MPSPRHVNCLSFLSLLVDSRHATGWGSKWSGFLAQSSHRNSRMQPTPYSQRHVETPAQRLRTPFLALLCPTGPSKLFEKESNRSNQTRTYKLKSASRNRT
ncbi:hypothetical protein BJ741DRAFT_599492 [Chytriomyces cf. hyalinus JEL632]|nr:hypothetical protein BJ741DRAFT_599492 [Chytriomyces cf. hyalinus JEL632]